MPGSLPKVTDSKIRRWVGGTYADRGQRYFRNGQVVDLRWRDGVLMGKVQGSEEDPYTVRIKFVRHGQGLEGDCSCPMAYGCKHVAALLYAYASAPPSKTRVPALEKSLAKLDRADLLALINAVLTEMPEVEELVEAHLAATRVVSAPTAAGEDLALRQEVQKLLQRLDRPGPARAAERGLVALQAQAQTLAKSKNWEAAQTIRLGLLNELMLVTNTAASSRVDEVVDVVVADVLKGWQALPAQHPLRRDSLRGLFDFIAREVHQGWGGTFGPSETILKALSKNAAPAEREQLLEWIALAMRQSSSSPFQMGEVAWESEDGSVMEMEGDLHLIWQKMQKQLAPRARTRLKPKSKPKAKVKRHA